MNIFKEQIQINAPQKSKFDMSHERKLTLEMGKLVPIAVMETLPGDSIKWDCNFLLRVAPMLAPLFHRLDVYTHWFYIPNRLVWNEWETFITGGADGLQAPVHPVINIGGSNPAIPELEINSLVDYMGIPVLPANNGTSGFWANALPFRAYQLVYDEYYRDENLVAKVDCSKASGQFPSGDGTDPAWLKHVTLRTRSWEKDYFTTALPFAQKGNASAAPVEYSPGSSTKVLDAATNVPVTSAASIGTDASGNPTYPGANGTDARIETEASVLITEIRKAARLQEFLEAAARGGHRLTEWILHVFGVRSSDARIQRPEYLSGGKSGIQISEVLSNFQFSGDVEGKPQGNMAGHGIAVGDTHGFERTFEEHGFIIGIMSILPKANYSQGIEKMWRRPTRFDYYIPQFAHLGEQPVLNSELFWDPNTQPTPDDQTFGYQSRYADYKFKLSTIHGDFRETLAYWHMARKFANQPGLNQSFIECVPTKDIFAVPTETSFFCNIWNEVSAIRPLPYFANPKL